jgi:hypothetical protein
MRSGAVKPDPPPLSLARSQGPHPPRRPAHGLLHARRCTSISLTFGVFGVWWRVVLPDQPSPVSDPLRGRVAVYGDDLGHRTLSPVSDPLRGRVAVYGDDLGHRTLSDLLRFYGHFARRALATRRRCPAQCVLAVVRSRYTPTRGRSPAAGGWLVRLPALLAPCEFGWDRKGVLRRGPWVALRCAIVSAGILALDWDTRADSP